MEATTSPQQTYVLAHTAQCKLQLAANRPDRNLRFILGHALAFESLMLRIVEIEEKGVKDTAVQHTHNHDSSTTKRRVSFVDNSNRPTGEFRREEPSERSRRTSPPPVPDGSDSDEGEDGYFEDEEEDEDDGLGLVRYSSGSARPPPTLDDSDSEEDADEPKSPPSIPSEERLREIMADEGDGEMAELYETVRGCGCQTMIEEEKRSPPISQIWQIPSTSDGKEGGGVPRSAVIQIRA